MDSPKDLLKYVGPAIGASAALYAVYKALQPKPTPPEGAVILVTGCDTGIGRATAEMLSEKVEGYRVLAGCLTDAGIENLSSLKRANLVPFKLDVSSDESVKAMLPMVEKECDGKGLFALYNIAGVLGGSVVDLTTMAEFQKVMQINFFGVIRCIQTVYHLLYRNAHLARIANAKGRATLKPKIITISSGAAELPMPGSAIYSASKHALKGFLNTLRIEIAHFGIDVVEIRPFVVKTNIIPPSDEAAFERFKADLIAKFGDSGPDGETKDPYGRENPLNRYKGGADAQARLIVEGLRKVPMDKLMTPLFIADKMYAELTTNSPKTAVVCTHTIFEKVIYAWVRYLPDSLGRFMTAGFIANRAPVLRTLDLGLESGVKVQEGKEKTLVAA